MSRRLEDDVRSRVFVTARVGKHVCALNEDIPLRPEKLFESNWKTGAVRFASKA
jgi:hypothetical protein